MVGVLMPGRESDPDSQARITGFRQAFADLGSILLKKSPASRLIAKNGEFQNPKGRVLESKFPIGA